MIARYRKRRDWCAVGIVGAYAAANLAALYLLRAPGQPLVQHLVDAASVAISPLFGIACWYAARAKGYSGGVGALVAFVGFLAWGAAAAAVVFSGGSRPWSFDNQPRFEDNRLPFFFWIACGAASLIFKLLPDKIAGEGR